ncbi:unnamed protein product [Lactuca saligna]|uniref:Uncharacterized protein n=1 Tax=Lactuca saligna TaxID=75948 RepID=A0AA35YAK2_LACSI|nr:unnamed protein product [Lactuca saligna]
MSIFVMSDPHNLKFIGSILEEMLENVPRDNANVKVLKKAKKPTKKLRSPSPVLQEESESRTIIGVEEDDTIIHEEEDTATTLEPTPTEPIPNVSSPPSSIVPTFDSFGKIRKEPFLNLSIAPQSPPIIPPNSPMPSSPTTSTILSYSLLLYHQ